MKFKNNPFYITEFSKIQDIKFYPYVGMDYPKRDKRVLVFAHNIPVTKEYYEKDKWKEQNPTHFADAMEELTYMKTNWTVTNRNFIKGAVGLSSNYSENSEQSIVEKVDSFVEGIAFANFINGLVVTERNVNANVPAEMIRTSKKIAYEIIKILNPTHIVCWGSAVYQYLTTMPNFKVIKTMKVNQKGFSYTLIEHDSNPIHTLKVFHPSMPSFKHSRSSTHDIFQNFFNQL